MDKNKTKVTIIIPVYNVENYLIQCIESVIKQTLKEIEIICIDDGSTDRSLEIIKRYEDCDPRIVVYSKPNAGYGHTINYGLDKSHGKYISIVESDDFIDENGMEILYKYAEKNDADCVKSNYYRFSGGRNCYNQSVEQHFYNKVLSALEDVSLFFLVPCEPWGCIYKKDFLDRYNIRMNETSGASYQDLSWTFAVLLRAKRFFFIRDAFYHYRMDNLTSSANSQKKIFCLVDEKNYMEEKMREYKIHNSSVFASFSRVIYESYRWNYYRISGEFQYAFLLEWKKELLKQLSTGIMKRDIFTKSQWNEINNILYNMDEYFEKTSKIYVMKDVYNNSINDELYYSAFIEKLLQNKMIIFGTGIIAEEIICILNEKNVFENIICFCETKPIKKSFYQKKVFSLKDIPYSKNTLLVLAALETTQKSIVNKLRDMGFSNILSVDSLLKEKIELNQKKNL